MARRLALLLLVGLLLTTGCTFGQPEEPRLSLFVGVDVSGSFTQTPHFKDSLRFLSYYLYGHLNETGGLQKPRAVYVGSIGGDAPNEPKAFYPIQEFQRKSPREIEAKLVKVSDSEETWEVGQFSKRSDTIQKQILDRMVV